MTITLYSLCGRDHGRPFSPHCWKISMALKHKGLAYEERPHAFTAIPSIEGGVSKTVPILRDDTRLVTDSFQIALYLDEAYPDHPTLFGGEGGMALARFVESYAATTIHPAVTRIAIMQIHDMLDTPDQTYFRQSRQERLGKPIEEVAAARADAIAAFPDTLRPLRHMLSSQDFIGGDSPLFADYIVFGALQWLKITSGSVHLPAGDPVLDWFERCLDLHDGEARLVA